MSPSHDRPTRPQLTDEAARTILDSLSAHVAILDEDGLILETNRAWQAFAQANDLRMRPDSLHVNYLAICDSARGDSSDHSGDIANGIREVIRGQRDEFAIDYPCHSPEQKRWFYMRAKRLNASGPLRVVITHEDVTPLKRTEEALRDREHQLEETNTALRVLLQQRDQDKADMERAIVANIRETILPQLERLKRPEAGQRERAIAEWIERQLTEITSSFIRKLASAGPLLTPQEMQVASLIQNGCSSKEIADMLNVSLNTVGFHRKNIRRKLGLSGSGTSLHTYLASLA
jgi:DNA-binding NarL/FixJ family response regulator